MIDSLLKIRIPYEDTETTKELKFLNHKIHEYKLKLMYLESQDCRNSLLKETINEQKSETTVKFRLLINSRHELLEKIKTNLKDNNE